MTRGEHARAPPLNRLFLLPLFAPRAVSKATREEGRLSASARAAFPSALPSLCRSRARRAPGPRRSGATRCGTAGGRYVPCSDAAVRGAGHPGAAAVGPAGRAGRLRAEGPSGRTASREHLHGGESLEAAPSPANFPRRDRGRPGAGGGGPPGRCAPLCRSGRAGPGTAEAAPRFAQRRRRAGQGALRSVP